MGRTVSQWLVTPPQLTIAIHFAEREAHGLSGMRAPIEARLGKPFVNPADKGFARVLLHPKTLKPLIKQPQRTAQLPADAGQDDEVIHIAEVVGVARFAKQQVQLIEIECGRPGPEATDVPIPLRRA